MNRRLGAWIAGGGTLAALLGCGGIGAPTRVVVARAGGIDPAQDARLAADLAARLRDVGFVVEALSEPLPLASLADEARSAASDADAATAVVLRLSAEDERPGVVEGTRQHVLTMDVWVVSGAADHPVATESWTFSMEEYTPEAVERRVLSAWTDVAAPFALEHLFGTPPVAEALVGQPSVDQLAVVTELRSREGLVARRSERTNAWSAYCAGERQRLDVVSAEEGSTCPGDPCVQRTLLGAAPDGRAVVQVLPRIPIVTVPPREEPYWWEPPEALSLVRADGQETTMLTANNLYGYGGVVPGAPIGGVEWFGVGGVNAVVGFSIPEGTTTAVSLLKEGEESRFSRASPAGLLVCLREGGGCFTDAGAGRTPAPDLRRGDWAKRGDGWEVVGTRPDDVLVAHVPGGETRTGARVPGLRRVLGTVGDRVRLTVEGCALVEVDAATLRVASETRMPLCLDDEAATPDGRVVGLGTLPDDPEGDVEVVAWDPATGAVEALTKGGFPEEGVAVAPDGRVWFDRQLEPPPPEFDTRQYRRVVCTLPPRER